jgi:hypothetical protein
MKTIIIAFIVCVTGIVQGQIYISADGTNEAVGSLDDPVDILTGLGDDSPASPGDTIYIRGGVYSPSSYVYIGVNGSEDKRITIMPYQDETVVVDGVNMLNSDLPGGHRTVTIDGNYITLRDIIITTSYDQRWSNETVSDPTDINEKTALDIYGDGAWVINNIIYDNVGNGMGAWTGENVIIYGNIVFNNGWDAPDRGHGHGVYLRNAHGAGIKTVSDNIFFNAAANGIDGYAGNGQTVNMLIEGNTAFNSGVLSKTNYRYTTEIFVSGSGEMPISGVTVSNNMTYQARNNADTAINKTMHFGYRDYEQSDIIVTNNYMVGANVGVTFVFFESVVLRNNYISSANHFVTGPFNEVTNSSVWNVDYNQYFEGSVWEGQDHAQWQARGFDKNGSYLTGIQNSNEVFVRPNAYEVGRANITIFNRESLDSVDVDLSSVLSNGDDYYIYDVENLFTVIASGTYAGGDISIPMNLTATLPPSGDDLIIPQHTEIIFGAYLLLTRQLHRY